MIVFSPTIWMTSPSSCSSPTNWTSYIRGRSPVAVTTGPATRKISPVSFRVAQDLRDLRLQGVPIDAERLSDPRELEPLDELIPSDGGEFHLKSPGARG